MKECKKIQGDLGFPIHFFSSGHNHTSYIQPIQTITKRTGHGLQTIRPLVVNGGSFLVQTGTYANDLNPVPQDLMVLRMRDNGDFLASGIPINRI